MPILNKKLRERREWSEEHREALTTGMDFFHVFAEHHGELSLDYYDSPIIEERRRQAWEQLRRVLLPEWIAARPFTRPTGWWKFDAPEPRRRCLNRQHPHDNPERLAYLAQLELEYPNYRRSAERLSAGIPSVIVGPDFELNPRP